MGDRENEIERGFNSPLTRRALLELIGKTSTVVSLGGFLRLFGRKERFLRPPGAPTEGEFLSLCIKCQKCQEVCPTGTITPVLLAESAASVGTPKLSFRLGYCNLCVRCIEVCPTGALRPPGQEAIKLGVAEVDRERCVAWTWAGCTQCQQVCPLDAIVLDHSQRPTVDASKCNGCGLCEYICPSSALRSHTSAGGQGIVVVPLGA